MGKQIVVNNHNIDCLISIGDSFDEFKASEKVAKEAHIHLHRIKLKRRPCINELMKEQKFIKGTASIFAQQSQNETIDYAKEDIMYRYQTFIFLLKWITKYLDIFFLFIFILSGICIVWMDIVSTNSNQTKMLNEFTELSSSSNFYSTTDFFCIF